MLYLITIQIYSMIRPFCGLIFLLASIIAANNAQAEKIPLIFGCSTQEQLKKKVEFCEYNGVYVEEARKCNSQFQRAVQLLRAELLKEFDPKSKNSQEGEAASQRILFESAIRNTWLLINSAEETKKELAAYLKGIVYPEDSDVEEVNKGNIEKYAFSFACFGQNKKNLQEEIDSFEKKMAQIKTIVSFLEKKDVAMADILHALKSKNEKQANQKKSSEVKGFHKSTNAITKEPISK